MSVREYPGGLGRCIAKAGKVSWNYYGCGLKRRKVIFYALLIELALLPGFYPLGAIYFIYTYLNVLRWV